MAAKKGYDPVFGARPLARVIQREVRDPLTDEILFGKLENGGTVTIGTEGDAARFVRQRHMKNTETATRPRRQTEGTEKIGTEKTPNV